jgi:hypothetical protein
MPIRLNLLAENQAIEDLRRRDPVKRVIWVAGGLIALLLVWASLLQVRAIIANKELGQLQTAMNSKTSVYKQVMENQQKMGDANAKLAALHSLATNRFLYGSLLHTLQQTTVDEVQLAHLKVDQSYVLVEAIKGRTNGSKVLPGTPATTTEKITLSLDASDTSASPGDQVTKFKEALAANPHFHTHLSAANQVNLKNLSAPQISPDSGRAMVLFTLEWRYPDITR